jgi:hypothetical protein
LRTFGRMTCFSEEWFEPESAQLTEILGITPAILPRNRPSFAQSLTPLGKK